MNFFFFFFGKLNSLFIKKLQKAIMWFIRLFWNFKSVCFHFVLLRKILRNKSKLYKKSISPKNPSQDKNVIFGRMKWAVKLQIYLQKHQQRITKLGRKETQSYQEMKQYSVFSFRPFIKKDMHKLKTMIVVIQFFLAIWKIETLF